MSQCINTDHRMRQWHVVPNQQTNTVSLIHDWNETQQHAVMSPAQLLRPTAIYQDTPGVKDFETRTLMFFFSAVQIMSKHGVSPWLAHCTNADETDAKKIITASPFEELQETTRMPPYYVDEDYLWLRIIHSGDWRLNLAVYTPSGVCHKRIIRKSSS